VIRRYHEGTGGKKEYLVSEDNEGTSGTDRQEGYEKEIREQVMRSISGIYWNCKMGKKKQTKKILTGE
jgi:hypothetical protein